MCMHFICISSAGTVANIHFSSFLLAGKATLRVSPSTVLKFITGLSTVPPFGLRYPIQISYQPYSSTDIFPKAQACFSKLMLPVVHKTKEEFFSAFRKALEYGGGYGNV